MKECRQGGVKVESNLRQEVGQFRDIVGEVKLSCAEGRCDTGRRVLKMELPSKRRGGRPKRWFMDVVREDMQVIHVTEEDLGDGNRWKQIICCADPLTGDEKEFHFHLVSLKSGMQSTLKRTTYIPAVAAIINIFPK